MAFKDYFNDNNDEDEEFEEEVEVKREFKIGNKLYSSVEDLRRNASFEDLEGLLKKYDSQLDNIENVLNLTERTDKISNILLFVGFGAVIIKNFLPGILKNVLGLCAPVLLGVTACLKMSNKLKLIEKEKEFDELLYLVEEIDEELTIRQQQSEYEEGAKEIFPDVYGEEMIEKV